jgi:hypothetical protein
VAVILVIVMLTQATTPIGHRAAAPGFVIGLVCHGELAR